MTTARSPLATALALGAGCWLLLAASMVQAGTGDPDPAFGVDGVTTFDFGSPFSDVRDMFVDAGGGIVIVGSQEASGESAIAVARFLADGSLDTGFGTGGIVVAPVSPGATSAGLAGGALPDGRLVVTGSSAESGSGLYQGVVLRYLVDGTLDATFGTGGIVLNPAIAGEDLAVLPDGRIVVAGVGSSGLDTVRLLPDGSLDASYGSGGVSVSVGPPATVGPYTVAVQADGKVLAGGTTQWDAFIVRFDVDGSLDTSFGNAGVIQEAARNIVEKLIVEPSGRIIALTRDTAFTGLVLRRYTSNGTLDTTFGDDGEVATRVGLSTVIGRDVVLGPSGDIAALGLTRDRSIDGEEILGGVVARYDTNGERDLEFGLGGFTLTPDANPAAIALLNGVDPVTAGTPLRLQEQSPFISVRRFVGSCPAVPDADLDGTGDACDPCTTPPSMSKPLLKVRRLGPPDGDELLIMKGAVPLGAAADIDPIATGIRLRVADATGRVLVDAWVPGGERGKAEHGWSSSSSGLKLSYINKAEGDHRPVDGISLIELRRVPARSEMRIKLTLVDADLPVTSADLPLSMSLVLEPPRSVLGRCAEEAFTGPDALPRCDLNSSGTTVVCR